MIVFKDFAQKVTNEPTWFNRGKLENLEETIQRMNNWIDDVKPDIINIETTWIPYRQGIHKNIPIKLSMSDGRAYYPIQTFRVWYRVKN